MRWDRFSLLSQNDVLPTFHSTLVQCRAYITFLQPASMFLPDLYWCASRSFSLLCNRNVSPSIGKRRQHVVPFVLGYQIYLHNTPQKSISIWDVLNVHPHYQWSHILCILLIEATLDSDLSVRCFQYRWILSEPLHWCRADAFLQSASISHLIFIGLQQEVCFIIETEHS